MQVENFTMEQQVRIMPYSRYKNIPEKKKDNGCRVRRAVLYPSIPRHENDIYVLTTPGDTTYALADQYYNDVNYYWIIAEANDNLDKFTQNLKPGLYLRIPSQTEQILKEFEDLNDLL